MNCPICLIGGVDISVRDGVVFVKCSKNCFDVHAPEDYKIAKVLLHNYLLQVAETDGRKAYLFSPEKNKNNPYTHEAYAYAWDMGYQDEQYNTATTAYKLATKQQEEEYERQLPIVKAERATLTEKYSTAREFIIHLATRNWWFGGKYRDNIVAWIKRNPY